MKDVLERALARWGKTNPTPDDVLMEACPEYHVTVGDTILYHSLASQVIEMALERALPRGSKQREINCANCGELLTGKWQRKYCSRVCARSMQYKHLAKTRYCVRCGGAIPRDRSISRSVYGRKMYCSLDCRFSGKRDPMDAETVRDIEFMYAAGVSVKEICRRTKYHHSTIYKVLKLK